MNYALVTLETIREGYHAKGYASRFFRLDNGRGVKFYRDKTERDMNYERQKRGSMFGLAPNVYDKVDLSIGWFGYEVELVIMSRDAEAPIYHRTEEYDVLRNKFRQELWDKVGIRLWDTTYRNMGWKNGRLVLVDFGGEGMDWDCYHHGDSALRPKEQSRADEYCDCAECYKRNEQSGERFLQRVETFFSEDKSDSDGGCQCGFCRSERDQIDDSRLD